MSERKNMQFKGTAVTTGSCHAVVTHTGMKTELGQIASLVQEAEDEQTPLERRLEVLGRRLLWITLGILIVVAAAGIARGKETFLMVKTTVALAVAAIPEGLPIVATIAMARGMLRMAQHNALVNHLAAVETLGSTTVICTDKTGTLTENRMTVTHVVLDDDPYTVRGGPKTSSAFTRDDRPVEPDDCPTLKQLLEASVLCNNASLGTDGGAPAVGDPLETALLEAGVKAGMDRDSLLDDFPEEREESFDPATKMMATFNRGDNGYRVMVKGAPEAVLRAVTQIQTDTEVHELTAEHKQQWNERNLELAQEGLRLLAVATKTTQSIDTEPYEDLTLLGLVAMLDPPRDDVPEAMTRCQEAGIRVVMVTGDHRATALSVAQAIGLDATETNAIEGTRIQPADALSQQDQRQLLKAPVFARVSPEQKLNLIDLHKQAGGVVAMTGDGVNDAPALKKADIGVAMGRRGTQVARDAADMILKNDTFSSIVVAVEQGRIIFDNIRTFVLYLLSGNVSEILVVFFASSLNWPLPILPLQILFLNVINDVFPALALGVGKGRQGVMTQRPRDPQEPVLRGSDWWAIFAYGGLIMVPVLASYWLVAGVLNEGHPAAVTASFPTLAFARLWHIFNMRSADSGLIHNEIVTNRWVWGALVLCCGLLLGAVYTPGLAGVLSLSRPGTHTWIVIAALSLIPPILGQKIKVMQRVHRERKTQAKG